MADSDKADTFFVNGNSDEVVQVVTNDPTKQSSSLQRPSQMINIKSNVPVLVKSLSEKWVIKKSTSTLQQAESKLPSPVFNDKINKSSQTDSEKKPDLVESSCQTEPLQTVVANLIETACQTEPPQTDTRDLVEVACQTEPLPEKPAEQSTGAPVDKAVQTCILPDEEPPSPGIRIIYYRCPSPPIVCTGTCPSYSPPNPCQFRYGRVSLCDQPLSCSNGYNAGGSSGSRWHSQSQTHRRPSSNACAVHPACGAVLKKQYCSKRSWSVQADRDDQAFGGWRSETVEEESVLPPEWRNRAPFDPDLDLDKRYRAIVED
ncbi:hypothetical protein EGW08_014163 [Elysia chlorotica]|uniref:Uncharacterized protein n=1 Tax=Elysia chlorotica TaxID=188477 RepID=A0A433T903_ELYCH|nr:hypothetical protein EGW08_014163 [Elysia chlorotica]